MIQDALLTAPTPTQQRQQERVEQEEDSVIYLKAVPIMNASLFLLRAVSTYSALLILMIVFSSWTNLIINLTPYGGYILNGSISLTWSFCTPILCLVGACLLSAHTTFVRDCARGDYLPLFRTAVLPDLFLRPCANVINWYHRRQSAQLAVSSSSLSAALRQPWPYRTTASPFSGSDKPSRESYVASQRSQMALDWLVIAVLFGVPLIVATVNVPLPGPSGFHIASYFGRLCAWLLCMHQYAALLICLHMVFTLCFGLVSAAFMMRLTHPQCHQRAARALHTHPPVPVVMWDPDRSSLVAHSSTRAGCVPWACCAKGHSAGAPAAAFCVISLSPL